MNKEHIVGKDHIVLLSNFEQKFLKLQKRGSCLRHCVFLSAPVADSCIRNPELLSLLKNHSNSFQHCVDVTPIRPLVLALLEKVRRCDGTKPYANDLIAAYVTELLVALCRLYPELPFGNMSTLCKNRIFAVQRYLDTNYSKPIKIAEVCREHYISTHYLSHQFKLMTGYSPKQYLTLLRLKHAAILLHDTRMPVRNIVQACGFSDSNIFCKQFKREYQCTPGEFRTRPTL